MNSIGFRNICQNIKVCGEDGAEEPIWVKQLRIILNTDIHENELGCKCQTHIKIGDVHLGTFFEGRILFSHSVWVERFSRWLNENLESIGKKKVIIVGYETDIETILFSLQQKFEHSEEQKLLYGIYEEKKYTQNSGYAQTEENIRYIKAIMSQVEAVSDIEDFCLIFLSGISSSLSTFYKMKKQLKKEVMKDVADTILKKWDRLFEQAKYYSIIQVLPDEKSNQSIFTIDAEYKENIKEKRLRRLFGDKENIDSSFLVDVNCTWYDASKCPMCYPKQILDERPIIATSETSLVPFQMIKLYEKTKNTDDGEKDNKALRLLWNSDGYKYVYYDHIDRMDHHFKYYVRTAHLIKDIIDGSDIKKQIFIDRCKEIKQSIFNQNPSNQTQKQINIIVYPSNFGDEVFPLAINKYVFDGKAYMLSINPNKEFRSNFETKYSNLSYILEQLNGKSEPDKARKLHFHYIAKQLLSIETFSRIKSLINSMLAKNSSETEESKSKENESKENESNENESNLKRVSLFSSVIIFLSRVSESTKRDYIKPERYYTFINIKVPSLRNYGDSCPICKRRQEVADYTKTSSLDICASHWVEKFKLYKAKSIEKAIVYWDNQDVKIKKQKYARFECENSIWENIGNCNTKEDYLCAFIDAMGKDNGLFLGEVEFEKYISYVKAISGPFLFYREGEKEAALFLILQVMEKILNAKSVTLRRVVQIRSKQKVLKIKLNNYYEQYIAIVVMLNCLANMDSTYILNPDVIVKLCNYVYKMSMNSEGGGDILTFGEKKAFFGEHNVEPFLSCVAYAFKRVICGISGADKSAVFDLAIEPNKLNKTIDNHKSDKIVKEKIKELFRVLMLENVVRPEIMVVENKPSEGDIITKYESTILSTLTDAIMKVNGADCNASVFFAYKDSEFAKIYTIFKDQYNRLTAELPDEELKNQIDSLQMKNCGWTSDEKCSLFVISLRHYSVDEIDKEKENQINNQPRMFMVIKYNLVSREDEYESKQFLRIKQIRELLKYKYSLSKIIATDIATNSIREAIQAREAKKLISSSKTVSHNTDEDIYYLLKSTLDIQKAWNCDNENANEIFNNLLNQISICTSYCIGKAVNAYLLKNYYGIDRIDKSILVNSIFPIVSDSVIAPGHAFNTDMVTRDEQLIEKYFEALLCKEQKIEYIDKHVKSRDIEILYRGKSDGQVIKRIINSIKEVNALPTFVSSIPEGLTGGVFLVGILDLFMRDVSKHSEGAKITVNFLFNPNRPSEYSIEVSNPVLYRNEKEAGATNWFFELINSRRKEIGNNSFFIDRRMECDVFTSKITVYRHIEEKGADK